MPKSTTASIKGSGTGTLYSPTGGTSGPTISFDSLDRKSHLEVTVAKQSDGKYYVIKVSKS